MLVQPHRSLSLELLRRSLGYKAFGEQLSEAGCPAGGSQRGNCFLCFRNEHGSPLLTSRNFTEQA